MVVSVFVTGASRGIGLEMIQQLASNSYKYDKVYAASRTLNEPLKKLIEANPGVHHITLDVTDEKSIKNAVEEVKDDLGDVRGLNYLVNNAGINHKSIRLEWCTAQKINDHFMANVTGPTLLSKEFLPLLKVCAASSQIAMIANMSSYLGSFSRVNNGLYIPYRMSKASLNMLTLCLHHYYKEHGIQTIAIDPGWVSTDMGGSKAPLTPTQSVNGILKVLEQPPLNSAGRVVDYTGTIQDW